MEIVDLTDTVGITGNRSQGKGKRSERNSNE